jgi:hypothetical protein
MYQQNEQLSLTFIHLTQIKTTTGTTYDVRNPGPVLGRTQECDRGYICHEIPFYIYYIND